MSQLYPETSLSGAYVTDHTYLQRPLLKESIVAQIASQLSQDQHLALTQPDNHYPLLENLCLGNDRVFLQKPMHN
jgi:hypothetical protein